MQWMSLIGLIALFGIIYIWEQVQTRDLKRDIIQLEIQRNKLAEDTTRLRVQALHLSRREIIQPIAHELLQLDYPAIGQVMTLPDRDGSPGQRVSPVSARATVPASTSTHAGTPRAGRNRVW